MFTSTRCVAVVFILISVAHLFAQSPNTGAVMVAVTDQTGGAVPDARVSIVNGATGAVRDAASGTDGLVTVAALPIMGSYRVSVTKAGFSDDAVDNVVLRGGETATLHVILQATGGTSEVTVYGTVIGVRGDPELGTRVDSQQLEETPVLGRKVAAVPLLSAAFRPAKGTGDLFMNSVYVVAGAGGRRETDFIVDGASGNEPWGRQTMFSTIPVGAVQEINVMSRAFSSEFGWTASAGINIITKAGSNATHGEALFLGRPGGMQPKQFSADQQCPAAVPTCVAPTAGGSPVALVPPDTPDSLAQGSFAVGGPVARDRTHTF